jgi:hypothetical protein
MAWITVSTGQSVQGRNTYRNHCGIVTVVGTEDESIGCGTRIPSLDDSFDDFVLSQLAF